MACTPALRWREGEVGGNYTEAAIWTLSSS